MADSNGDDKRICSRCIENKYLKKTILSEGEAGRCSECSHRRRHTVTIDRLGQLLLPVLAKGLERGEEIPFFRPEVDTREWHQEGEELEEQIPHFLGQDLEINEDIARAVSEAEVVDERQGDIPLFDDGVCFVRRLRASGRLDVRWESIQEELKYRKRFFNAEAKNFFDAIFSNMEALESRSGKRVRESVIRTLRKGARVFRARACSDPHLGKSMISDAWKQVGPPPRSSASEGRMNGKGVVMLYGAFDRATCIAELRPALRQEVALIQVEVKKTLRLLDFVLLEDCRMPQLDYFEPDYQAEIDKFLFRLRLGERISQPIVPGSEQDYLVTQTMAEYLAYVHQKPLDGIVFRSSQRKGGRNVVLFSKSTSLNESAEAEFPVEYVKKSLEFHSIDAIVYKHSKQNMKIRGFHVR